MATMKAISIYHLIVDTDKAKASFKKGMLWIIFPKKRRRSSHKKINSRKIRVIIKRLSVTNQITIFAAVTSKEVKKKIMEEFHRNASIDAAKITVEVDGDTVTLKGTVRTWSEMKEAQRAA